MSLATANTVATYCSLGGVTNTTLVTSHIPTAVKRLEARLGSVYTAVATPTSPYGANDKTALTRAESLLAGALILRAFLARPNDSGLAESTFSPDGAGTKQASQEALAARANNWEALAWEIVWPYEQAYLAAVRAAGTPVLPASVIHVGRSTFTSVSGRGNG